MAVDRVDQFALAPGSDCHRLYDWDTQGLLQRRPIYPVAALLGDVAHVQSDEHGSADPLQLEDESEV